MVAFWILATLMTLLALAVVLVPLLRARAPAGPSAREVALNVLRGQRREIERHRGGQPRGCPRRGDARAGHARRRGPRDRRERCPARRRANPGSPRSRRCGHPRSLGSTPRSARPASDPKTLARNLPDDKQILGMVEPRARCANAPTTRRKALLARSMPRWRFQECRRLRASRQAATERPGRAR